MPTSEAAPSQCIPKQQLLQGHQQPVVASIQGSWGVQAITGGPSASVQATANVTGAGGRGGELNRAERLVSASEQLPLHELVLQQAALAEEALLMGELLHLCMWHLLPTPCFPICTGKDIAWCTLTTPYLP
jgi:hypothetical protein